MDRTSAGPWSRAAYTPVSSGDVLDTCLRAEPCLAFRSDSFPTPRHRVWVLDQTHPSGAENRERKDELGVPFHAHRLIRWFLREAWKVLAPGLLGMEAGHGIQSESSSRTRDRTVGVLTCLTVPHASDFMTFHVALGPEYLNLFLINSQSRT